MQLADGQVHSGQALAAVAGVSRTAIWKQIQQLGEMGLTITRSRGQGYRLEGGLDLLDATAIEHQLVQVMHLPVSLHVVDITESTNVLVGELHQKAVDKYTVSLAEQQSAGRGRRGRRWISPFAKNLYLSVAFDVVDGVKAIEGLSLAVGVMVENALAELGATELMLKWPNDILWHGQKLAGILIELQGELDGRCRVIVGIGINLLMDEVAGIEIDQPWVSLKKICPSLSTRTKVACDLVAAVIRGIEDFQQSGFAAFRSGWMKRDALFGQALLTLPQGVEGVGDGIDETGAYRLITQKGLVLLDSGEVSLKSR